MSNECWNVIGVEGGDRSCERLKTEIHCRNCPVYSAGGRSLLEREPPQDYVKEWTEVLAKVQSDNSKPQTNGAIVSTETLSVMIFMLGGEWLALPVRLLQEVTQPCVIHTLPHRSSELFQGLVNIRGEILMCVSLGHLLDLKHKNGNSSHHASSVAAERMIVVANEENRWVFSVEEVSGIHRFQEQELRSTPVVISKASETYTKGVFQWQGHKVNYLDADLLFYTLNRRIL